MSSITSLFRALFKHETCPKNEPQQKELKICTKLQFMWLFYSKKLTSECQEKRVEKFNSCKNVVERLPVLLGSEKRYDTLKKGTNKARVSALCAEVLSQYSSFLYRFPGDAIAEALKPSRFYVKIVRHLDHENIESFLQDNMFGGHLIFNRKKGLYPGDRVRILITNDNKERFTVTLNKLMFKFLCDYDEMPKHLIDFGQEEMIDRKLRNEPRGMGCCKRCINPFHYVGIEKTFQRAYNDVVPEDKTFKKIKKRRRKSDIEEVEQKYHEYKRYNNQLTKKRFVKRRIQASLFWLTINDSKFEKDDCEEFIDRLEEVISTTE